MNPNAKIDITVSFKGMDSSDAAREYAEKRCLKISKHIDHFTTCHFVLLQEKKEFVAQLHMVSNEFEARAEGRDESMYAALDTVTDKMAQQTRKHKEKVKDHSGIPHHNKNTSSSDTES